jgi:hypothetical protein
MLTKKLLVLDFGERPPEFPGCPGLLSIRKVGTKLELVVDGFGDEHLRQIESLSPRTFEILDLDTQDACFEDTCAPRRPPPILAGEGAGVRDRRARSRPCAKPLRGC